MKKQYIHPTVKCYQISSSMIMNPASPGQEEGAKEDNGFMDEGACPEPVEGESSGSSLWTVLLPLLMFAASLMASCYSETEYITRQEEKPDSLKQTLVYLNMPAPIIEDAAPSTGSGQAQESSTRGIQYTFDDRLHAYWSGDVTIGVFPVAPQVNSQVKYTFSVPEMDKSFRTRFVGVGWGLKANNTYAAYFPYRSLSSDLQYDSIPVSMTGQKQIGNGNLDNFGQFEYLYAKAAMPEDTAVTFDFKRQNAIIWLQLDIPYYNSWRKATIYNTNGDSVFINEAYMNVSTGEITATRRSPYISIDLSEVRSGNEVLNIFISAIPTKTGPLLLSIEAADQDRVLYAELSDQELKPNVVTRFKRTPTINQYLYADLGLPSGTKWAKVNLGAFLPYETGGYYSWGNAYSHQSYFYWSTYTFCSHKDDDGNFINGNSMSFLNKYTIPDEFYEGSWYNSKREFIGDNLREIELIDDAANRSFGSNWRIPSSKQFQELIDCCEIEWESDYSGTGVQGYRFTGPNGNSIFLPAAGWIGCENQRDIEQFVYDCNNQTPGKPHFYNEEYEDHYVVRHWLDAYGYNHSGYYWTRDLDTNYSFNALECKFTEFQVKGESLHSQPSITDVKRYVGCTIRPVMQP